MDKEEDIKLEEIEIQEVDKKLEEIEIKDEDETKEREIEGKIQKATKCNSQGSGGAKK